MNYPIMDLQKCIQEYTTLDSSRTKRDMGEANKFGQMAANMKVSGKMTKRISKAD